ncbi:alpha/beta fold hydrolase [Halostagnicola kamekurae]|uniref:alpha/beta fold hydrolase n=1 Tax=Halostagnicola kamekurae TaxID=619731 RepID=UPI001FE811FA|nr:alpha/beta hydrolase [Halostagnicola kamekurae]
MDQQQMNVVPVDSDRQITYTEYGCPDGVPVVFLHGTPGSRQLGALFEAEAQENGVRVLAPDRPGYGRSSPWPNRSVRDAAEFVTPVLDDADVQTAGLIAFSGGSPYALSIAATQAERINQIDIIAGATPPTASDESPAIQRLLASLATTTPSVLRGLFRGQMWLAERLDPSFVVGQYTANDDAVANAAAEIVKEDFVEAFAHSRNGAVIEFRDTATDWGVDFDEIDVEVRLWHGSNDTNVPIAGARRLEGEIPSAELHVLDDADHLQTLLRSTPHVMEGIDD